MEFGQCPVWAGVGQYEGALGLAWKRVPGFGHRLPGVADFGHCSIIIPEKDADIKSRTVHRYAHFVCRVFS